MPQMEPAVARADGVGVEIFSTAVAIGFGADVRPVCIRASASAELKYPMDTLLFRVRAVFVEEKTPRMCMGSFKVTVKSSKRPKKAELV
jgi:hypothetical protein